jgi:hypothetical protein
MALKRPATAAARSSDRRVSSGLQLRRFRTKLEFNRTMALCANCGREQLQQMREAPSTIGPRTDGSCNEERLPDRLMSFS